MRGFLFFLARRREVFVVNRAIERGKDCFVENILNLPEKLFLFFINIGLKKIFYWIIFII